MRVLEGIAGRRPTALEEAYQVFRLERQGSLVAPRTLEFYDRRVGELIAWLHSEAPTVERVEDVGVNHLRARTHSSAICSGWSRPRPTTLSAGPVVGYIERNVQNSGNLADLGEGSQAPQGVGLPSTLRALSVAERRGTPPVPGQLADGSRWGNVTAWAAFKAGSHRQRPVSADMQGGKDPSSAHEVHRPT